MRKAKRQRRRDVSGHRFALLSAYSVRLMLGLAASLGLLVFCFRLPVQGTFAGVGWGAASTGAPLTLKDVREVETGASPASGKRAGAPLSSFGATATAATAAPEQGGPNAERASASASDEKTPNKQEKTPLAELPGATQLHTLDRRPRAIGGIGGLYLKIDYPTAARRDSIQGRLVLHFIVEEDGSTSHVRVTQSLHPLCDSAAVAAVRRTRFLPGRRGGETVRVPLSLPVRFKLVGNAPMQARRSSPDTPER